MKLMRLLVLLPLVGVMAMLGVALLLTDLEVDVPEPFTLDNGLTVLLRPVDETSDVAVVVLFDLGGRHDPVGRTCSSTCIAPPRRAMHRRATSWRSGSVYPLSGVSGDGTCAGSSRVGALRRSLRALRSDVLMFVLCPPGLPLSMKVRRGSCSMPIDRACSGSIRPGGCRRLRRRRRGRRSSRCGSRRGSWGSSWWPTFQRAACRCGPLR